MELISQDKDTYRPANPQHKSGFEWMHMPNYYLRFILLRIILLIPLSIAFLIITFMIFDCIHHIVGLFIHACLGGLVGLASLLTFHWYPFVMPDTSLEWNHFSEHVNQVRELFVRYKEHGNTVGKAVGVWAFLVAVLFAFEGKRVTFKEAFRTAKRDQIYVLKILYRIFSGIIDKLFGWLLRAMVRFASNEQLYEIAKQAAKEAARQDEWNG